MRVTDELVVAVHRLAGSETCLEWFRAKVARGISEPWHGEEGHSFNVVALLAVLAHAVAADRRRETGAGLRIAPLGAQRVIVADLALLARCIDRAVAAGAGILEGRHA